VNACLNSDIVGGAVTPDGGGYWLVGSDGEVFTYGTAHLYGSASNNHLDAPIVGMASTADGKGYWLAAADGGVFAYGDAKAPANNPLLDSHRSAPVVGISRAGNTNGIWLTTRDGGVFSLGGAPDFRSTNNLNQAKPVSTVLAAPGGTAYRLAGRDGGVSAYSVGSRGNAVRSSCVAAPRPGRYQRMVQIARAIENGAREPGWTGGAVPYSWGGGHGTTPGPSYGTCFGYTGSIQPCGAPGTPPVTKGVDCSGLSRWVYSIALGKDVFGGTNTDGQWSSRFMKKTSHPVPGDLAFFGYASSGRYITHHVGIYVGNGKMINAFATGTNVQTNTVKSVSGLVGYWHYTG
jgi:hypothetical protein